MKLTLTILSLMFFLPNIVLAFEAEEPDSLIEGLVSREAWGAEPPDHQRHLLFHKAKVFVIGHTVVKKENAAATMRDLQQAHMNRGGADILFHFVFGSDQKCYEGRDLKYIPAIVPGRNFGVCAIGLEGRFDDHRDATDVTDEMLYFWARQLAAIARTLGIFEFQRGSEGNIFAECELTNCVSPGQRFMNKLDDLVHLAQRELDWE